MSLWCSRSDVCFDRCQFSTFEQCQEWLKRLNAAVRPPSQIEELFSFAFHAWCVEKEQHGDLCRPGTVWPSQTLSACLRLKSDVSQIVWSMYFLLVLHSQTALPLKESTRYTCISLQRTTQNLSNYFFFGNPLPLYLQDSSLTRLSLLGDHMMSHFHNEVERMGFDTQNAWRVSEINNKYKWVFLSQTQAHLNCSGHSVLSCCARRVCSGLDDFRQASVSQSDHTALCLPPGTGYAPATLSCCWCQPGLLIRSWRMWRPSAPGRGFRPWFTGQLDKSVHKIHGESKT